MPRTRARAASIDSDDLDGTSATPASNFASLSLSASGGKSTPATTPSTKSPVELSEEEERPKTRRRSTRNAVKPVVETVPETKKAASKKRAKPAEDDSDDAEEPLVRPVKRRQQVFVEIPSRSSRVSSTTSLSSMAKLPATPAKKAETMQTTPSSRGTRASRTSTARSKFASSRSASEVLNDDTELDYDEEQDDRSDSDDGDSGSEFELSDDDGGVVLIPSGEDDDMEEVDALPTAQGKGKGRAFSASSDEADIPLVQVMAVDDDEEADMMRMAIEASVSTAFKKNGKSATMDMREAGAAAAERRLTRKASGDMFDVDDSVLDDDLSALDSDSEDGGGFIKTNGKGKAAAKPTKKRTKRAKLDEGPNTPRGLVKAEMKKLGRKLTWAERTTVLLRCHHPELKDVWGDLERTIKPVVPEKADQPADLKATLLPFQRESLYWMGRQEEGVWKGGCLADEMGMGKTIQTLALLASDRTKKPNLIIAPTVALMQWRNEIETHTVGFKVATFYGSAREKDAKALANHDVVLTTYSVLESTFRRQHSGFTKKGALIKEKSVLHEINWSRVVLDEAHNIKERSCNTAKATFELKANWRWCLSGTPLQNRVGELYSLVRFLGGDPFSYYFCKQCPCKSLHWSFKDKRSCDECGHSPMNHTCFWNNEILTPIQRHAMQGPGQLAFKKLKVLLDRMMLRRTKLERADDLGLPPRTVVVRRDYFSPEEKELYLSLFSDAKRQFSTYVEAGTILNNYSNVFSLITRMRQMACHPDLVLKSKRNTFSQEVVEAAVCRLCNDVAEDAIESKCHHLFDRECIRQYIDSVVDDHPACPVCHLALSIDLDAPALELDESLVSKARQGIIGRLDFDGWRSSSKIEALVEELSNLRREDRTTKSIVFSQFVNFLDLIAWRLQRAGFNICRLEGSMSPQARDLTIKHFMNNVEVTVFLVSLKAGGVALNLVEASRVYLMDSWWNPAVEYQAMDRIHRLGQHRPVQAIKLVVEDSIESRIVQLQEKKSAMVDATLSRDDSAMGRLTPEDLGFLFRL